MQKYGFKIYPKEWGYFTFQAKTGKALDIPIGVIKKCSTKVPEKVISLILVFFISIFFESILIALIGG